MWYERYGFVSDPYTIKDPFQIEESLLEWNREDLEDTYWKVNTFVDRAVSGYRVGLGAYGPVGSGKTWLLRIIEKSIKTRLKDDVLFLYARTHLPVSEPSFATLYSLFIDSILEQLDTILSALTKAIGNKMDKPESEVEELKKLIGEEGWRRMIREITPDVSLSNCLWHFIYHADKKDLCLDWLRGERLPSRDLHTLEITTNLDKDFRRVEAVKSIVSIALNVYSLVVLVVDEMENARPMTARVIGDSLRDLLDSFSGNFSVICSYTGQRAEELIDLGYGTWLHTRLEYYSGLEALTVESIVPWLSKHNTLYRRKAQATDNPLLPFNVEAIQSLLRTMMPTARYPRHVFVNCGHLGQAADEAGKDIIDQDFIAENRDKLSDLTSQTTLM